MGAFPSGFHDRKRAPKMNRVLRMKSLKAPDMCIKPNEK